MQASIHLDRIVTEIRAAAKECGALIIEAVLSIETNAIPAAAVDSSDFAGLVKHVRPRLIYLVATPFDADNETLATLEVEDESLLERPGAKKLISKWRHRNGETCRLVLGVMCDGVLHCIVEEADWFAEFESEAETLKEELERAREEREQGLEAEERKALAPQVKQLMADPRFSGSKVGVAKRTALAESLFPDLDRDTIRAIVERAESDHWLATAGR